MAHTVHLPPLLTSLASVPQTVGLQSQSWIDSHDLSNGFLLVLSKDFCSVCLVMQCLEEVNPECDPLSWWKCPQHVQEIAEMIAKAYRLFDSGLLVHCFLNTSSCLALYWSDVRFQDWYFCSDFLSFLFIFLALEQHVLAASGFASDVCVLWRIAWHPCYSLDSLHIL